MKGPDPIETLLGEMKSYDRSSFDKLQAWAINAGCPDDAVAFYLLGFCIAFMVRGGASTLTIARVSAQIAELAVQEIAKNSDA